MNTESRSLPVTFLYTWAQLRGGRDPGPSPGFSSRGATFLKYCIECMEQPGGPGTTTPPAGDGPGASPHFFRQRGYNMPCSLTFFSLSFVIYWFHSKLLSSHFTKCAMCAHAVLFNLFAAAETSANVSVADGTLWDDPSVYPTFCTNQMGRYVSADPGSHSRNLWVPQNPGWKTLVYSKRFSNFQAIVQSAILIYVHESGKNLSSGW